MINVLSCERSKMRGRVLLFDEDSNEGEIVGDDEMLYEFHIGEWLSNSAIKSGCRVGFEVVDEEARNIVLEEELRKRCEIVFRVEVSIF